MQRSHCWPTRSRPASALIALIVAFGPRSGAHFNPVVTIALAFRGDLEWRAVVPYVAGQFFGAIAGVIVAHVMFDLALLQTPQKLRTGIGQWTGELVATFGLVYLVLSLSRKNEWAAPFAVGGYIAAAYWFHFLHLIRKSGCYPCERIHRYVRRYRPRQRAGFRGVSDSRGGARHCGGRLAPRTRLTARIEVCPFRDCAKNVLSG